jgi:diguanylate cyclase (GGDEF)-like protein
MGYPDPGVYDVQFRRPEHERDMELAVTPLEDARGATAGRVLVFRDITERRELERELRRLAYTDRLTGLPNRALFHDRLERALVMATRRNAPMAVLFLDLDRFKIINDSLGHQIGDEVLVAVARRLRGCLRAEDTLARLGGDEFAILLPEMADRRDVYLVSDKCLSALSGPELIGGHELTVNASIGVAISPQDGTDVQQLLRSADAAMYRAKARGGGRAETFTHLLGEEVTRRHQIEVELRRGLRTGQLHVLFQPYHELVSGRLVGYEALVRWDHPRRGILRPDDFLPLAEETGLIDAVDRWVLGEACRQARQWRAPLLISVNVSAGRLRRGGLDQDTATILADTGLDPTRLILELSERILFDEMPDAFDSLTDLTSAGVGLALDDFGAGYTSLEQLRRLPVSQVKIDRSLIAPVDQSEDDAAIVAAVIQFAHALGLSVTAEGIERQAQLDRLTELGCDCGQGFLFSAPAAVSGLGDSVAHLPRRRALRTQD